MSESLVEQIKETSINSEVKMFKLKSADEQIFEISEQQLNLSELLQNMVGSEGGVEVKGDVIPVKNVNGDILAKVLEWCSHEVSTNKKQSDEEQKWVDEFLKLEPSVLEDLWAAGNYLVIQELMDLVADYVIDHYIKDKPVQEIRETFGIVNDFTPEEEAEILKQNDEWFNFDDVDEAEDDDDDDDDDDFNNN